MTLSHKKAVQKVAELLRDLLHPSLHGSQASLKGGEVDADVDRCRPCVDSCCHIRSPVLSDSLGPSSAFLNFERGVPVFILFPAFEILFLNGWKSVGIIFFLTEFTLGISVC